jgi:hypothetical protein
MYARSTRIVPDQDVQEAVRERGVRSGRETQVKRGRLGRPRPTRIGDDQRASPRALRLEVLHDRGHGLGEVAAGEQDGARAREVGERERQAAVHAEGLERGRRPEDMQKRPL